MTWPLPLRRLRPTDLSGANVESPAEWFSGWWYGIAVGCVIGAGSMVIFLKA